MHDELISREKEKIPFTERYIRHYSNILRLGEVDEVPHRELQWKVHHVEELHEVEQRLQSHALCSPVSVEVYDDLLQDGRAGSRC